MTKIKHPIHSAIGEVISLEEFAKALLVIATEEPEETQLQSIQSFKKILINESRSRYGKLGAKNGRRPPKFNEKAKKYILKICLIELEKDPKLTGEDLAAKLNRTKNLVTIRELNGNRADDLIEILSTNIYRIRTEFANKQKA